MKHLSIYINENLENHLINEGKIFQAIKNWFKKIFEPTDKKFDRFTDEGKYIKEHPKEYKEYLSKNFKLENTVHGTEKNEDIEKIINQHPGYKNVKYNKDHKYHTGFYVTKDVREDFYIVDLENIDDDELLVYKIYAIYIIDEFKEFISIQNIIDIFFDEYKDKEIKYITLGGNKLIIYEKDNKELYQTLVNKCEFKEETNDKGEKIAIRSKK